MYRQILLDPRDFDFQRILWSPDKDCPAKPYHHRTVTYGTSSAPYLAIRTLHQLASDEGHRFPFASQILKTDIYVDDVLTGADTINECISLRQALTDLLQSGGFPLRKWAANHHAILDGIPSDHLDTDRPHHLVEEASRRVLGISWKPQSDVFSFQVRISGSSTLHTKRSVLSVIAQLFDPLGWLSPVIIRAKIFMQQLWVSGINWDDPLPTELHPHWSSYQAKLHSLSSVSIPRWIGTHSHNSRLELHGFSDASEKAFAAVIYARVLSADNSSRVSLIIAKTKVAPLKQISIPRLELCAALLLTRLMTSTREHFHQHSVPIHLWSDSTITLSWIRGLPSRWRTYVANRTSEIQTSLPQAQWHFISGQDNPADIASRGISPDEIQTTPSWWNGPPWLSTSTGIPSYQFDEPSQDANMEVRVISHVATAAAIEEPPLLHLCSSWTKILRLSAWRLRFIYNRHRSSPGIQPDSAPPSIPPLTPLELNAARLLWIRRIQHLHLSAEFSLLRRRSVLPSTNPLIKLSPFIDESGIMRVGGRLKNSLLDYDERHPIILPRRSLITERLISHAHSTTMHGGPQQVLGYLRRQYWIPGARPVVRSFIHRCVRCLRYRASPPTPPMGQLPASRVCPARPFRHTGVDYAGPILLRTSKGRGHKAHKGFIVVFVCFATKAIHLEVASDYSSEAFLAAYRRFTSRRGICRTLTSDCGTNLVGADTQLRQMFQAASAESRDIANHLASDGTEWKFNPPSAPHFGGLWEAGVKSVKFHLRRTLGDSTLTFEELSTLLSQVEACLNSRPLQPLTDDPDDLSALTPGHFLIGAALTTIPEPSLADIPLTRLSRWQLIRQMYEHFWERWATEYLHQLNSSSKWHKRTPPIAVGDLCIVQDQRYPPSKWPLGRITQLHPGNDGEVRVVTLRTASSDLKRPVVKLCLLPRTHQPD